MTYVDGFLFVVKKNKIDEYKAMAKEAGKVWKRHGAINYKECMAEDMSPKHIKLTFPKLTKTKKDEIVFFSYITYKNKAHRNKVNSNVMKELEEKYKDKKDMSMPFDMNRMSYGGFKTIVDL